MSFIVVCGGEIIVGRSQLTKFSKVASIGPSYSDMPMHKWEPIKSAKYFLKDRR